jgi:hypothetical protein
LPHVDEERLCAWSQAEGAGTTCRACAHDEDVVSDATQRLRPCQMARTAGLTRRRLLPAADTT